MKKAAQQLWTEEKYNVMAKSYSFYKKVQSMLRDAETAEDFQAVVNYINDLKSISYEKKAIINTFEHIWGYFKKQASIEEKDLFFAVLKRYLEHGEDKSDLPPAELLNAVHCLLEKYPSAYLKKSALLGKQHS